MEVKQIFTFQARNGMIIAEDIYNEQDMLVITKNSTFTAKTREILIANSIIEIKVFDQKNVKYVDDEHVPSTNGKSTLTKRIKDSPEFKQIEKKYSEGYDNFKKEITAIIDNKKSLVADDLISITMDILDHSDSTYHIFDMLHSLNNYDDSTYSHSLNVSLICSVFADWLHFDYEDKKALMLAGIIHDVGKLQIPDTIIKKPDKLNEREFRIVQNHPALGYNIVKDKIDDTRIKAAVLMHHEKCDGSGYPSGLMANKIPDFAKIVTIADVYEAMTATRVYRGALCPFEVIRIFEDEGFQKYDPRFILTFLSNVCNTYLNNNVELNDGRVGKIVLINQDALSRPMISIDNEYIDLRKNHNLSIVNIL